MEYKGTDEIGWLRITSTNGRYKRQDHIVKSRVKKQK